MVLGPRNKQSLGWMPIHTFGVPSVTFELRFHLAQGKVKDLEGRVVAGGDKLGVAWAEGKISNRIGMCVDALDIVEVWLPVFDNSIMIRRNKPVVTVGVLKRTNSGIVSLHDGLEIETGTVP
ncbi:hypothetical protein HG530_003601 [Fusarium avenaceum]|nr:hypothetical protein HG530_003601 [Fusarium avenaceum]